MDFSAGKCRFPSLRACEAIQSLKYSLFAFLDRHVVSLLAMTGLGRFFFSRVRRRKEKFKKNLQYTILSIQSIYVSRNNQYISLLRTHLTVWCFGLDSLLILSIPPWVFLLRRDFLCSMLTHFRKKHLWMNIWYCYLSYRREDISIIYSKIHPSYFWRILYIFYLYYYEKFT